MTPMDELRVVTPLEATRLRQLIWIKVRLALPPIACMIGGVGVLIGAELALFPRWIAYFFIGGLFVATLANHIIAANALCPNCRVKFYWSGRFGNLFRLNCPHCGFGPPAPDPLAIASGYLGLMSVLVIPAPLAMATSLICLRKARGNPNYVGRGRAIFGLIMGLPGTILFVLIVVATIRS